MIRVISIEATRRFLMKKRNIIGLFVFALAAVGIWQLFREDYGVGVESVWFLPPDAKNITFCDDYLNRIAEFDIDQEAMIKWCQNDDMPLREVVEMESCSVRRCLMYLEGKGEIPEAQEPNKNSEEWSAWSDRLSKYLDPGDLYFEESHTERADYLSVGYDVNEGRGYYAWSHR